MAVSVCEAFDAVVVFHETEYGEDVASALRFAPSSWNWSPSTPLFPAAVARTTLMAKTAVPVMRLILPPPGHFAAIDVLLVVTVTAVDVVRFPAASRAMAVSVCEAFDAVVV